MLRVGMLRRVRLRAIRGGFRLEIFEKFSRPQNFAFEIARDRVEVRTKWRRPASPRLAEVLKHIAEPQNDAP